MQRSLTNIQLAERLRCYARARGEMGQLRRLHAAQDHAMPSNASKIKEEENEVAGQ